MNYSRAMNTIEYKCLDQRAGKYVRDHLHGEHGEINTFCTALLKVFDREKGEFFTLAPKKTADNALYQFESGGLLETDWSGAVNLEDRNGTLVPTPSLKNEEANWLRSQLAEQAGSVCIIDDFNPVWGEETYLGVNPFGVEKSLYHLLTDSNCVDDFKQTLSDGETFWHRVAAICANAPAIDSNRESTPDELQMSATSVIALTCTLMMPKVLWAGGESNAIMCDASNRRHH